MNFANAVSCVFTASFVPWSVSSSVSLLNLVAALPTNTSGVPKMIQGIILVSLIASDFLLRYRIRVVRGEEA